MKKKNNLKRLLSPMMAAILIASAVVGCVEIDGYNIFQIRDGKEVLYAMAGEDVEFTLNGHIECHEDHGGVNFVVGFLAPKDWNVAQNARVTYTSGLGTSSDKVYTMSVIPASQLPKNGNGRTWVQCLTQEYGVGTNVLDDMEWVVFQTDDKYDINNTDNIQYTITFRMKAGPKNLKCHLGFFVNHTDDGFSGSDEHKKVIFTDECFEVRGGSGATLDFCNNHYNKTTPMSSLQDDFVTFTFNGDMGNNGLVGLGKVYFVGEAVTEGGRIFKAPRALMTRENMVTGVYNITLWPKGFFGVPEDEQIDHINYYFTNEDESITVTQSDDDYEQLGIDIPEQKQPFTFPMTCD